MILIFPDEEIIVDNDISPLFKDYEESDKLIIEKFSSDTFKKLLAYDVNKYTLEQLYGIAELANYLHHKFFENICINIYFRLGKCEKPNYEKLINFTENYDLLDWNDISTNISLDYIKKHPDKPWNWKYVSQNKHITMDYIETHLDMPWIWREMYIHIFEIYFIEKYIDKPWDWFLISWDKRITIEFIEKHIDKPWDWGYLSNNKNITMDFIEKYIDKPWDWRCLSDNKNITMDFVKKHNKPWNFNKILLNTQTQEHKKIILQNTCLSTDVINYILKTHI